VRAGRRDLTRYVHAGWIAAIVAGVATWYAATHLIAISGADRELAEGFGAILAALVLLFVGVWMHDKSRAGAWQTYVQGRLDRALGTGSIWLLFGLSFVAVYREAFETILFYAAIGAEGSGLALLGGMALAIAVLAALAWAMIRFARRLPIEKFFRYSAILIAILAVVLAGKGLAALQEAGLIGVTPLAGFPRSPLLGLYPTAETVIAQLVMIALILLGWLSSRRKPLPAAAA